MNELRPCPFCGGPAKIHKQFDGIHPGMIRGWFVNCNSKGCPIFATTRVRKMKADAIAEWNTRIDIKNPAPGRLHPPRAGRPLLTQGTICSS